MMARAHASRIYAKFAVHTRQEFNEVLDGCLPPRGAASCRGGHGWRRAAPAAGGVG